MSFRRRITALTVTFGLLAFSLAAFKQISFDHGIDNLPSSASDLATNWAAVETIEAGDDAKLQKVATDGLTILKRAPLEEDVLTQVALARHSALTLGSEQSRGLLDPQTLSLLQAAQDRNPRNRTVANTLYRNALNGGEFDETVAQLDLLYRTTHPQRRDNGEIMALLSALVSLETSRPSVLQAIEDQAAWSAAFLNYLSRNRIGPGLAATADYLAIYARNADPKEVQPIAQRLISRLAQDHQLETAYNVWTRHWPQQDQSRADALNADTDFSRTAPAPFGWATFAGRDGSADLEPSGGLYAVYHNGPDTVLAEQIFLWPSGQAPDLNIHVRGTVNDQPRAGRFLLNVDCFIRREDTRKYETVRSIELNEPLSTRGEFQGILTDLDPDCRAGRLRLVGSSGEFSQTISMSLRTLSVSPRTDD